jgi:predicted nucleotide-binding protein with TIR-like domain
MDKRPMKPVLFVGCSSESLDVAYAAQENLDDCAQVIVWTQGLFDLSRNFLESLLDALDETEFGLFVFAPDDLTRIRGRVMETTRDNVIFELGLFIGRLGRERTFIIMPKDIVDLHLPSDLLGINTATFAKPENQKLLVAALGAACNKVRRAIQEASSPNREAGDLGLALSLAVPEPQQKHLLNLAEGKTKGYEGRGSLRSELRNLVSIGLLEKLPGRHVGDMKSGLVYDLADFVNLTDRGRRWVDRIRQPGDWTPQGP